MLRIPWEQTPEGVKVKLQLVMAYLQKTRDPAQRAKLLEAKALLEAMLQMHQELSSSGTEDD